MITYRFCENLTDSESQDWDALVLNSLGAGVHPHRQRGFKLAREALRLALRIQGHELAISSLKLSKFHLLPTLPQYVISLSHSPSLGSAVVAERKVYRSIGIDIEKTDRIVKDHILSRVSHPEDINLRNIELWCLKEAIFKSLMNTDQFEAPIEFSSIQIQNMQWIHSPSQLSGEWKLDQYKDHVVALAWIKS